MSLWLVPMIYAAASFLGGITLPRLEQAYLTYDSGISVASAQAFFTAVASGMIALTGIVFTVGLVMVQFSAIAYSPRIVLLLARDPKLFHSLGVFIATFTYSLCALLYVDRNGSGVVPLISGVAVAGLLLLSMLLFSALMKGLTDLQITCFTSSARAFNSSDKSKATSGLLRSDERISETRFTTQSEVSDSVSSATSGFSSGLQVSL